MKLLKLCSQCLRAVESREGYQRVTSLIVSPDEEESTCSWCKESGFDTLYLLD